MSQIMKQVESLDAMRRTEQLSKKQEVAAFLDIFHPNMTEEEKRKALEDIE